MPKLVVHPSIPLSGSVLISGSKNAALPIIAATLLSASESTIEGVPDLIDITIMCELIKRLGCDVTKTNDTLKINPQNLASHIAPYDLASKLRGSFLVTGPLLARLGKTQISLPGGCSIGTRPVDLHLKGFKAMGAKISQGHGYVEVKASRLHGNKIYLDFPSVGATENIIMAATLSIGQTIIENAATEPEIVDLAMFLSQMGAQIFGAGTDTIKINGVKSLNGAFHRIIPDRIEAGTFMVATAITKGVVTIENIVPSHLKPITAKLREIGILIEEFDDKIKIDASSKFKPVDIKTLPFPGFPTDMQAQFMSLMSVIDGTSIITETVFENRFMHASELMRMGANIKIEGRSAVVEGIKDLTGAQVRATDLRAGAALVLAGLAAKGDTEIAYIEHIERGYASLDKKLIQLGANIERIETIDELNE